MENGGKKRKYKIVISAAVLLCVCLAGICFAANSDAGRYDKVAEQFAQYEFDAVNPGLCYADAETAIIYDSRGIVVYNIKNEKICGYASFEEIGPIDLQGSNPTFVKASGDGKYVYVFSGQETDDGKYVDASTEQGKKYLFDVSRDTFEQVDDYDFEFESSVSKPKIFEGSVAQKDEVYSIGEIFEYADDGYCYLGIEPSEKAEDIDYSNLRLVVSENGVQKEYAVFE